MLLVVPSRAAKVQKTHDKFHLLKPLQTRHHMASSLIIFILFLSLSSAQNDVVSVSPSPSSPARFSPFRPSIAVIVGVFTTIFSIIFLLLLYAKYCVNNNSNSDNHNHHNTTTTTSFSFSSAAVAARKNSGIDRAVVESLPVFRFGSLLLRRSHSHHYHLDCAVCLCRFDDSEVLRLLPKCCHAFHVECVDTWLDAHSTCPLCRFRVDPEDVLLTTPLPFHHHNNPPPTDAVASDQDVEMGRRVSGRHSSAGERRRALFQMVDTASFRRSLDSWSWRRKRDNHNQNQNQNQNQSKSSMAVGWFDRKERKDGLLLTHDQRRRLEHRIIVSPPGCGDGDGDGNGGGGGGGIQCYNDERWSDVQPSDLLYLRSEMIMSDSRRFSSSAGAAAASSGSAWAKSVGGRNDKDRKRHEVEEEEDEERSRVHNLHSSSSSTINGIDDHNYDGISGRRVINTRSVSEITGLTRLSSNDNNSRRATNDTNQQQRRQGLLRRWLAWVSQLRPPQQDMV